MKKREPGYMMGFSSAMKGESMCLLETVCARVKVKGRCGEEGSSGRGNKNSLGCVCVRANYDILFVKTPQLNPLFCALILKL